MPTGKGPLRIALEDFLESFKFGERIRNSVNETLEEWEIEFIRLYELYMDNLGITDVLPEFLKPATLRTRTNRAQVEIILIIGTVLGTIFAVISAIPAPFTRFFSYKAEKIAHSKRPDTSILLQMIRRNPKSAEAYRAMIPEDGYNDVLVDGFDNLVNQLLSAREYIAANRRGILSFAELDSKLISLGIEDSDITTIKALFDVIPSPSDLITMAVREAFDENFISQYKTAEDVPPALTEWAAKQGLSAEWSRRYWIAHWQLPSPQQVFEMLHRLRPGTTDTPIVSDDVKNYLKAADYSPFWRDKLEAISYNPYTRVDVRRMYKTGVLTEAQVKEAHLDLGYDDEHAQALTQFTIAYEAEEETGIVRTSVLQAYGDGMIDRVTAEGMLQTGGYDTTTIKFYLDNVDFREALEINQIKLANIKKRFIEGIIDETTVNNEINLLDLPAERVTALLELWLTERENQVALPTLTQVENFYELGIVTIDDFKRILKRRGYSEETINWNIQRIDLEKASKAQKDAEKAEADSERLNKSKTASQYQKDKAEIDLAIAQARAEITDIDVALHGELTDEQAVDLATRKDELKQFIAQLNISKAQLRFDTTTALDNLVKSS